MNREHFRMVIEKCMLLCNHIADLGHQIDVEAQDLLARLTLDTVLTAGFGIESNTLANPQPVPLLQELHYAMDESFRCWLIFSNLDITTWIELQLLNIVYLSNPQASQAIQSRCAGIIDLMLISRTFSEPGRALILQLLPSLPAAKKRKAHFTRLYSIWDNWIKQMQARGAPAPDDDSIWACITRIRDPATGNLPLAKSNY